MVKKLSVLEIAVFTLFILPILCGSNFADEVKSEDCFFKSSLHHTNYGMNYWYSKENGGLENLTGIPYSSLDCRSCHITTCCDECHKTAKEGKTIYSANHANQIDICLKCHNREKSIMKIDKSANQEDVHFSKGMVCMDCHTQRELHGDGTIYNSMKQEGAMDADCKNCHEKVVISKSHVVHKGKLDCKACHTRHVLSCTNCHFDTFLNNGKKVAIPQSGWTFLMNYRGKVSSANMQTFLVENKKTFLLFAPNMSHSIMKEGRHCGDCHASDNIVKVSKGSIDIISIRDGKAENLKGIIPVVDGVDYKCVYMDREDGNWVPVKKPDKPLLQYAGYGEPLSDEQLKKLSEKRD